MIHWLVQSQQEQADLANGRLPQSWLSPAEMARLASLKTEKRQRDWQLGRWTAKQLLQQVIADQTQEMVPLHLLEISNSPDGDPIIVNRQSSINNQQSTINNQPLTLSISHSHNHAFCAVVSAKDWPLGADMELIEPRADVFVEDYLTAGEREMIATCLPEMRDVLVTAVWSAKEAVLKALHLGLTVDTRRVQCMFEPVTAWPTAWTAFATQIDIPTILNPPILTGWWQTYDNFVLTVAVKQRGGM